MKWGKKLLVSGNWTVEVLNRPKELSFGVEIKL
jgi:hypothetical protein